MGEREAITNLSISLKQFEDVQFPDFLKEFSNPGIFTLGTAECVTIGILPGEAEFTVTVVASKAHCSLQFRYRKPIRSTVRRTVA